MAEAALRRLSLDEFLRRNSVAEHRAARPARQAAAADEFYAEAHRRAGAQWIAEILHGPEAQLVLSSGLEIALGEL